MRTFKQIYQDSYDEIRPDEKLVEDMLEDARTERQKWMQYAVLRPVAAVVLGVMVLFGGTSALASNVGVVYGVIERVSPKLADLFVPIQESCTKAGICMEVEAIYLGDEDKTAEVLVSFKDTQGDRIKGPICLNDSYSLYSRNSNNASWVAGGAGFAGYDEETSKAYYRIQLSSDAAYERNKLTFQVNEVLLHYEEQAGEISLEGIASEMPVKYMTLNGGGGSNWERYAEEFGLTMEEPAAFQDGRYIRNTEVMPDDPRPAARVLDGIPVSECVVDDFTITGLVYRDNVIQLQICNGDLSHSIRYALPSLKLADGSERHYWFSSSWSEYQGARRLAFDEYYLPCTPEELKGATLYANFAGWEDSLENKWKVTFRVEDTEETGAGETLQD